METQLSTFATIMLGKYVNTGDRVLDGSIITIGMLLLTFMCRCVWTHWRAFYNRIVYRLYGKYNAPWDLNAPYLLSYSTDVTSFEEISKKYHRTCLTISISNTHCSDDILRNIIKTFNIHQNPVALATGPDGKNNRLYASPPRLFHSIPEIDGTLRSCGVTYNGYIVYVDSTMYLYSVDQHGLYSFVQQLKDEIIKRLHTTESSDELSIATPEFSESKSVQWKLVGKISKRKTFDFLFYDQKPQIIQMVKKFQTQSMYPSNIPMDNKLGILLYGPPGTGKTGTISAIANMLKMHICLINFHVVQTCAQLDAILDPKLYKEHIFVFDEIDCILDVISNGTKKVETKKDWGSILLCSEGEERKQILDMMRSEKTNGNAQIDMAYLLQKLDGLESAEGRVIIATTNHPEKLHPALVRPGRFDLKLCLGNCSKSMYIDILSSFYKNDEKVRRRIASASANLPEFKHTPLTVINHAIQEPNLEKLLRLLK